MVSFEEVLGRNEAIAFEPLKTGSLSDLIFSTSKCALDPAGTSFVFLEPFEVIFAEARPTLGTSVGEPGSSRLNSSYISFLDL